MASISQPFQPQSARRSAEAERPAGSLRFDWAVTALSVIFTAGLWVDGWAHFHGQVDDSFFTPWHFLFYSAFGLTALFMAYHQMRGVQQGRAFQRALPAGYWPSLLGVALFAAGGVGDMIWHTLFGIEDGSEALTSPTHILLAIGMALVFSGPLRAAWLRGSALRGWWQIGPAVVAMTLLVSLLGFFTSYAHPLIAPQAASFANEDAAPQAPMQLYSMNADGSAQTRLLISEEEAFADPEWSPDGSKVAYAQGTINSEDGETDLYVMNADGSGAVQITDRPGLELSPSWSPDGTQLVFSGVTNSENWGLFVAPTEGGEARLLLENETSAWLPAWSPDGSKIAFTAGGIEGSSIRIIDVDGSGDTALTPADGSYGPAWSPDGARIAFTRQAEGNTDVYVMNADGSEVTRMTDFHAFDGHARWTPDGESLLFISGRGGSTNLYSLPLAGGEPINLTRDPSLDIWDSAIAPDGERIVYTGLRQGGGQNDGFGSPQDAGVSAILFQTVLLTGALLLLVNRWRLPFGALTLLLTANALLITILSDLFLFIPGALITGLVADVLIARFDLSGANPARLRLFAFIVPLVYFALYFLTMQLTLGVGWSIHVWTGAIFLAGMVGVLLSLLVAGLSPRPTAAAGA